MEDEPRSQKNMMFRLMRAALEKLLSEVSLVRVIFINHPSLVAPESVKPMKGGTATFEYGLDLPVPIDDLEITDEGIRAKERIFSTNAESVGAAKSVRADTG